MTRTVVAWLVSLLTIALITLISVEWLDRPIALWVHDVFGSPRKAGELAASLIFSIPLMLASAFVILGLWPSRGAGFQSSRRQS
jgi:hypothetical protein